MSDRELEIPLPVTLERQTKDVIQRILRALKWLRDNPNTGFPAPASTGDILYFDGKAWRLLAAGTAGQVLTQAAGPVKPAWAAGASGFPGGAAQGDIVYYNGSAWVLLTAGTPGYYLQTLGAGANPVWAAVAAGIGGYNVDCIVDFKAANLNLQTLGDVAQVIGSVASGPSGTAVPAGVASGVTVTPVNSNAAWCTLYETTTTNGWRYSLSTTGTIKTVESRIALAQFGLDRSRPFEIRFLVNNLFRSFVHDGDFNRAGVFSATASSDLFAAMDEVDSASFGNTTPRSAIFGLYGGTYVSTGANIKNDTGAMTDDLWVYRWEPHEIALYSNAVSGAFPSTTPSDVVVGMRDRGRVSVASAANGFSQKFPNADDILFTHIGSNIGADIAFIGMHVIQRA